MYQHECFDPDEKDWFGCGWLVNELIRKEIQKVRLVVSISELISLIQNQNAIEILCNFLNHFKSKPGYGCKETNN